MSSLTPSLPTSLLATLHAPVAALALAFATPVGATSLTPTSRLAPQSPAPPAPAGPAVPEPARKAPVFGIQIGDVAAHTFEKPLFNGLGARSLEDLRGKPVLIDFWGVRCANCIGAAVPASLKLQETFGDDLQVLLVECHAQTTEAACAFALSQKWLGGRAIWTSEKPFERGTNALPVCVLLANDGRVLLKGNPTALHKEIERQIAAQIELRRSPPCGAPVLVRGAWSEFANGRTSRAFQALMQAEVENAYDPASLAAIADAREAFRARIEARILRVRWLAEHAWFDEADSELDRLAGGLRGFCEQSASLAEVRVYLGMPEVGAERAAARQLARLRARFFESGGEMAVGRELERFAEKHKGTPTGVNAGELVRLMCGGVRSQR